MTKQEDAGERTDDDFQTGTGAPVTSTSQSIEASVGGVIRATRKSLDMTIAELANQAGLSTGMVSRVENGSISPSLATLKAIAEALNVPMAALFDVFDDKRDAVFVQKGEGLTIERRGTRVGHLYQLLGHSLAGDLTLEPYLITLTEDAQPFPSFRHTGLEFIYMISGEVRYRHGERSFLLTPGDSLFFDSDAPHGPESLVSLPAVFLSIIAFTKE